MALPCSRKRATNSPDWRYHQALLAKRETVEPEFVGMAVDYLSRLMTGDSPLDPFIWAIRGAEQLDDPSAADEASEVVASIYRGVVDDGAIAAA